MPMIPKGWIRVSALKTGECLYVKASEVSLVAVHKNSVGISVFSSDSEVWIVESAQEFFDLYTDAIKGE